MRSSVSGRMTAICWPRTKAQTPVAEAVIISKILGVQASEMGIEHLTIVRGSTLTSVQLFLSASQGAVGGVRWF